MAQAARCPHRLPVANVFVVALVVAASGCASTKIPPQTTGAEANEVHGTIAEATARGSTLTWGVA